jgi:hypothetical protein
VVKTCCRAGAEELVQSRFPNLRYFIIIGMSGSILREKKILVKSRDGFKTKTIHSIWRVRKGGEGPVCAAGPKNDEEEEDDVFNVSDPFNETIDISNWRNKRVGRLKHRRHDYEDGGMRRRTRVMIVIIIMMK